MFLLPNDSSSFLLGMRLPFYNLYTDSTVLSTKILAPFLRDISDGKAIFHLANTNFEILENDRLDLPIKSSQWKIEVIVKMSESWMEYLFGYVFLFLNVRQKKKRIKKKIKKEEINSRRRSYDDCQWWWESGGGFVGVSFESTIFHEWLWIKVVLSVRRILRDDRIEIL